MLPETEQPRKPVRDVAWLSAAAFATICAGWLLFATMFRDTGWDFSQFYLAGSLPSALLYDRAAFEAAGQELLAPDGVDYFPPYVRPAVFTLPLKALAVLSYRQALAVFSAVQFAFFLTTLFLLFRRFALRAEFLPVFSLCYPAMMGIVGGQDPHTLTLLALIGFLLTERGREFAAGGVFALCLYKFNLVLWLPAFLLVRRRWRTLGSFTIVGGVLAATSWLLAPAEQYLTLLGRIEDYTINFYPENMIGLRGLALRLDAPWLYPLASAILLLAGLALMKKLPPPESFSIAVLGSLLCSYHVNWYDGTLALIPVTIALARGSLPAKIAAIALLTLSSGWVEGPGITALLTALWLSFAWSARGGGQHDAPAPAPTRRSSCA